MNLHENYNELVDNIVNDIVGDLYLPDRYLGDDDLVEIIRSLVALAYVKGEVDGFDRENFNHEL